MKFWLSPRCAELVASFHSFSSLWSSVGGFPGPMHPHLLCPVFSCRSALCLQSGAKFKQDQPLLPSRQKGPLTHLGQLPLQLTSGYFRSNLHPLFFLPPLCLALLSLPPSLFWFLLPPFLLPFCPSASIDVAVES